MTGLPSPGDGGAQGPVQVWVRTPAWGCFCPSGTALPWRRQPPNRPEQSLALTPLPTARPAFARQDPALSAARPPWASSTPATSSLGAHGSHPGLRGVGGGVRPHLDWAGPRWRAALPRHTRSVQSPGLHPHPDARGSVLTPRAQHGGLLPAGQLSILGAAWEEASRAGPRAQTADTEGSERGHCGRGLAMGLGESLTTRNPALLT